jgi:hypothetical protein
VSARRKAPAASAAALALAGCGAAADEGARAAAIERLLDRPSWTIDGRPALPEELVAVEVCGDVRPGFVVESGATLRCEAVLPPDPSWLDVEAAALPIEGEQGPPPRARLAVTLEAGSRARLLHDGFPSAGTPPTAFGFGRARIELYESLGALATFTFRVESGEPATGRKVALANPRIAPRATAEARPRARIDLFAAFPVQSELAAAGAAQPWTALERLVAGGGEWTEECGPARRPIARDGSTEVEWFGLDLLARVPDAPVSRAAGGSALSGDRLDPRLFDRAARTDPWLFRPDGPFVRAHAGWDRSLLQDRFRALGERTLFLELARPRTSELRVLVATAAEGRELDAALARLIGHLKANEAWERTDLALHSIDVRGGGAPTWRGAWVKKPPRP